MIAALKGKTIQESKLVEGGAEIHVVMTDGSVFVFAAQGQDKPHGPFVVIYPLG